MVMIFIFIVIDGHEKKVNSSNHNGLNSNK